MQPWPSRRSLLLSLCALSAFCAPALAGPATSPAAPVLVIAGESLSGDLLAGQFALAQGQIGRAAAYFLDARRQAPHDQALTLQAFLTSVMSGRPEAAALARALPGNPEAEMLLGDADLAAGRWQAAERHFAALPSEGITAPLKPLLIAWAQFGAGHTDTALATLRPAVKQEIASHATDIHVLHAALIADLGGREAEATRLYTLAEAMRNPLDLRAAQVLASWQARRGDRAAADALLAPLTAGGGLALAVPALQHDAATRPVASPTEGVAEAYLAMAATLHARGAPDFALLLVHYALALRPDLTPARIVGSEVEQQLGHPQQALALLDPVPLNDPLAPLARLRRAELHARLGQTAEAVAALRDIAAAFPHAAEPLAELGDVLRLRGEFGPAAAAYAGAIALTPHPGPAGWKLLFAQAIAYDHAGQWPRAEADLRHALRLSPNQPEVLNYLGYSWAERGEKLGPARRLIERAAALRPDDGNIEDSLGWVMLRAGDTADAVRTLERAAERLPEDPMVNFHLGDAYWAQGRQREATFQWQRALTLHPPAADAARIEARLRGTAPPHPAPLAAQQRVQRTAPATPSAD